MTPPKRSIIALTQYQGMHVINIELTRDVYSIMIFRPLQIRQ